MTDYSLTRSRWKTIAIHITKGAAVEVRAPLKAPKAVIDRFVMSKQDWIRNHLSAMKQHAADQAAFALNYGDDIDLQGRKYPITAIDGERAGFNGECFYLPPGLSPDGIKNAVIQMYRLLAKHLLTDRTAEYAKLTGLIPAAVKVNGAKTRWGSCSGKNSLNFSWRLVMADDDVIDYVVVHELAHIEEHNHSDKFWKLVAAVLPDHKTRQIKLKELQKRLAAQDRE